MSDIEFSNVVFPRIAIEFFTGDDGDHYWRLTNDEKEIINRSSEGFSTIGNAKNNLLILHTLIGVDLLSIANGDQGKHFEFYKDTKGHSRWRVKAENEEIVGAAHKGFDSLGEAKNNLLMAYSLISTCLAQATPS